MTGDLESRTAVVSSAGSAAHTRRGGSTLAAPASAAMVRKRRRVCIVVIGSLPKSVCSRLQFAFERVEEAPIRTFGDDLLRARLDEAGFPQPQRVEPEGILGVVFAPFVVRKLAQRLEDIFVPGGEP